jgi:L-fuculose-phosphate aldolase
VRDVTAASDKRVARIMSENEAPLRVAIVAACRTLWERGLVAGRDGNVSARLDERHLLITPAGFSKRDLRERDVSVVDVTTGTRVDGPDPSTEIALHLRAYGRRSDIRAVVHAHPATATAFAVIGEPIPQDILPEITVLLGAVPIVPYGRPGTPELADRFEHFWTGHNVFLMANHGALTLGPDLRLAMQRMESLEHAARVLATARTLGDARRLGAAEVRALEDLRTTPPVEW